MRHHNLKPWYGTGLGIEPVTFGLADECSTTELTHLTVSFEHLENVNSFVQKKFKKVKKLFFLYLQRG